MRCKIAFAFLIAIPFTVSCLCAADKYAGPVPPKPHIPTFCMPPLWWKPKWSNAVQGKKNDQYTISGCFFSRTYSSG